MLKLKLGVVIDISLTRCACTDFALRLILWKLNFVVPQYKYNKQTSLWLVRLFDFHSLVVKNY